MKKTLIKPHTHAGVRRKVGEEIDLRPDQVERLVEAGKVEGGGKPKLSSVGDSSKKKED